MKIDFNCYEVLKIPNFSSAEVIKKSYRKLALIHHPDKGGNAEKMKKLNLVKGLLLSDERERYDNWLRRKLGVAIKGKIIRFGEGIEIDISNFGDAGSSTTTWTHWTWTTP